MFYEALIATLWMCGILGSAAVLIIAPLFAIGWLEDNLRPKHYKLFLASVALLAFTCVYGLMLITMFVGDLHDKHVQSKPQINQTERTP